MSGKLRGYWNQLRAEKFDQVIRTVNSNIMLKGIRNSVGSDAGLYRR